MDEVCAISFAAESLISEAKYRKPNTELNILKKMLLNPELPKYIFYFHQIKTIVTKLELELGSIEG